MSDRYIDFVNSALGQRLVGALGLPSLGRLERWQAGRLRPIEGPLLIGGGALAEKVNRFANKLTDAVFGYGPEPLLATPWIPGQGPKLKAVVFDASELLHTDQLKQLREFFQPLLRSLQDCTHMVILGRAPETLSDPFAASAQRALEGFSRSLAKELRNASTLQLLYVGEGAEDQLEGALRFFLSPKSAFISGQVLRLSACPLRCRIGRALWPGARHWLPAPPAGLVPRLPKPWPGMAPNLSCWTCRQPKTTLMPWPHAWAGAVSRWTSVPPTPLHN